MPDGARFFRRLNLSIQSKLMLMVLLVSVASIGVVSWLSYSNAKDALTEAAFNQLTSLRASKKIQIEAFFRTIHNEVSNLADDRMIVDATRELAGGFDKFRSLKIKPEWDRKLEAFYRDDFLPKLAKGTRQTPRLEAFFPETPAARYAQYLYIANNPNPAGEKYKLVNAGDGSEFSRSHSRYQPILTKFMLDFHYDNLMLADYRTGEVFYTFTKSPIFGTSLLDGPYSETNVASLFRTIRIAGKRRKVEMVDFAPQSSAMGKPVALMGAPVFDGPDRIGVLLVQFPTDEINRVMTDNFGWIEDGLGKTGEVYLVGPEMLLRSRSRLLHEDPERYYKELEKANYPPDDIDRVRRAGTATLAQPARTRAVEEALAGKTGTAILTNYLGISTLSSFAPLAVPGLRWVIVAEMETGEAFAPLNLLTRRILNSSLIALLAVTVLASIFARSFVRPIFRLVDGAQRLERGEKDVSIALGSRDEFEDLGVAFNGMTRQIASKGDLLERTTRERDDLLDAMLPAAAAARMKQGQVPQIDEYADLSVLYASFWSRGESSMSMGTEKSLGLMNDLAVAMEDAALRRGVETLSDSGAAYVACCGLSRQRLDQASRLIDFAQDVLRIVRRLNRERAVGLRVRIGIDSGPAAGGVVGKARFSYHLAGESMAMAGALASQAPPDAILVSRQVYDATRNLYQFGAPLQIVSAGGQALEAWPFKYTDAAEADPPQAGADTAHSRIPTNVVDLSSDSVSLGASRG